jgi:hypothetical protein
VCVSASRIYRAELNGSELLSELSRAGRRRGREKAQANCPRYTDAPEFPLDSSTAWPFFPLRCLGAISASTDLAMPIQPISCDIRVSTSSLRAPDGNLSNVKIRRFSFSVTRMSK